MKRLLRNMILGCSAILLAGCQHPVAPSFAAQNTFGVDYHLVSDPVAAPVDKATQTPAPATTATITTDHPAAPVSTAPPSAKLADKRPVATAQPQEDSLTGQLADGLMLVFKTFTGR